MMKRAMAVLICLFIVLFAGYIWLMACFDGPISFDATEQVTFIDETRDIRLAWYHRVYCDAYGKVHGADAQGNTYTRFLYDLPEIFESAEMVCVVSWSDGTAKMYIGESRAMEIIDRDHPSVVWERYYTAF